MKNFLRRSPKSKLIKYAKITGITILFFVGISVYLFTQYNMGPLSFFAEKVGINSTNGKKLAATGAAVSVSVTEKVVDGVTTKTQTTKVNQLNGNSIKSEIISTQDNTGQNIVINQKQTKDKNGKIIESSYGATDYTDPNKPKVITPYTTTSRTPNDTSLGNSLPNNSSAPATIPAWCEGENSGEFGCPYTFAWVGDEECGNSVAGYYCWNGKQYVINLPATNKAYLATLQSATATIESGSFTGTPEEVKSYLNSLGIYDAAAIKSLGAPLINGPKLAPEQIPSNEKLGALDIAKDCGKVGCSKDTCTGVADAAGGKCVPIQGINLYAFVGNDFNYTGVGSSVTESIDPSGPTLFDSSSACTDGLYSCHQLSNGKWVKDGIVTAETTPNGESSLTYNIAPVGGTLNLPQGQIEVAVSLDKDNNLTSQTTLTPPNKLITSTVGTVVGTAMGLACGPAAVICVPIGAGLGNYAGGLLGSTSNNSLLGFEINGGDLGSIGTDIIPISPEVTTPSPINSGSIGSAIGGFSAFLLCPNWVCASAGAVMGNTAGKWIDNWFNPPAIRDDTPTPPDQSLLTPSNTVGTLTSVTPLNTGPVQAITPVSPQTPAGPPAAKVSGGSISSSPSGLTSAGTNMYALYTWYRDNPGWWNNNGTKDLAPAEFLGVMLVAEAGGDAQLLIEITNASSNQLWMKGIAKDGPYCNDSEPECAAGIFNYIGAYMASAKIRYTTYAAGNNPEGNSNTWKSKYTSLNTQGITLQTIANDTVYSQSIKELNPSAYTDWGSPELYDEKNLDCSLFKNVSGDILYARASCK